MQTSVPRQASNFAVTRMWHANALSSDLRFSLPRLNEEETKHLFCDVAADSFGRRAAASANLGLG